MIGFNHKGLFMRFLAVLMVFSFCFSLCAFAQDVREADVDSIERAETYMQGLQSAQARFVQTAHDGTQSVGTFYLQRPGKLRFEYDPPIENFIVADGAFIYFYDADLEQQSNAPIQATLANFFLRKDFSLTEDLLVQNARFVGDSLQIKVVKAKDTEAGSITFVFGQNPFVLKKWRVVDPQNLITEVELFHLKNNVKHDKKLFVYIDPKFNDKDRKPSFNN